MATFYFNAAVNNNWATLGNWWMNSSYTIAATALPTASDDVIIDRFLSENTGNAITVYNLTANYPVSAAMTVTGVATFNVDLFSGPITGNCIFNNNSINWTVINGDCIFNDSAVNDYDGTITGNCVFNDYSRNDGTIYGDCIFNNSSFNNSIINGNCTFNDNSHTAGFYGGTINGDCTFNDNATNYWISTNEWELGTWYAGTVNGNCTFSLSSAALSIDQALAKIKTSDSITGTVGFKYEKGINGSSILGVV